MNLGCSHFGVGEMFRFESQVNVGRSEPGTLRKVANITLQNTTPCRIRIARADRRASVKCDGTRGWLRRFVQKCLKALL